jgi:membrane protease YdiL (CAAX protease family)
MYSYSPEIILAAILTLIPLLAAAFFLQRILTLTQSIPTPLRLLAPAILCIPYILVTHSYGDFTLRWLVLYALLPVAIAALLHNARLADPRQRGTWRDYFILATLGLAVDLRWFEPAWPPHLAVFSKIILLDAGIYGFHFIRQLDHVGFDLRLRRADLTTGLRELAFYIPIAFIFTFFFIAIPEELFFRGWTQNLLELRIGRMPSLFLTAALFGVSHFNKRAAHFNWRYVLLAAIAGIFYGRAWRQNRRIGSSAITHSCVDTLWSLFLR